VFQLKHALAMTNVLVDTAVCDDKFVLIVFMDHLIGDICGTCSVGYYRDDDKCKECSSWGKFALPLCIVLFVVAVAVAYNESYRPQNDSRFGAIRIAINFVQITGMSQDDVSITT